GGGLEDRRPRFAGSDRVAQAFACVVRRAREDGIRHDAELRDVAAEQRVLASVRALEAEQAVDARLVVVGAKLTAARVEVRELVDVPVELAGSGVLREVDRARTLRIARRVVARVLIDGLARSGRREQRGLAHARDARLPDGELVEREVERQRERDRGAAATSRGGGRRERRAIHAETYEDVDAPFSDPAPQRPPEEARRRGQS